LLEAELDARLIPEVALVIVACREGIAKTGQEIVKLYGPNGYLGGDRNVDPAADDEVKRIVAGRVASSEAARAALEQVSIKIRVCPAE